MSSTRRPHDTTDRNVDELRDRLSEPDLAHVVVATREEDFLWAVFDGFAELPSVRVTGCSTIPQTRQICAADPPGFLVIDMSLLEHEPMALMTLANLSNFETHIIALTEHPVFEIGARFGQARLTFMQKPVSAHDLLLLLRLKIGDDPENRQADVC